MFLWVLVQSRVLLCHCTCAVHILCWKIGSKLLCGWNMWTESKQNNGRVVCEMPTRHFFVARKRKVKKRGVFVFVWSCTSSLCSHAVCKVVQVFIDSWHLGVLISLISYVAGSIKHYHMPYHFVYTADKKQSLFFSAICVGLCSRTKSFVLPKTSVRVYCNSFRK